jgi:hypothetical protein
LPLSQASRAPAARTSRPPWSRAPSPAPATARPPLLGAFNLELSGTWVGTVQLERSFDGGTTYVAAAKDTSGTAAAYTTNVSIVVIEGEPGVIYRVRCTAFTSGTVAYRLSAGPRLT